LRLGRRLTANVLAGRTGDFHALAYYLMDLAILMLIAVLATREMAGNSWISVYRSRQSACDAGQR